MKTLILLSFVFTASVYAAEPLKVTLKHYGTNGNTSFAKSIKQTKADVEIDGNEFRITIPTKTASVVLAGLLNKSKFVVNPDGCRVDYTIIDRMGNEIFMINYSTTSAEDRCAEEKKKAKDLVSMAVHELDDKGRPKAQSVTMFEQE